MIGKRNAKLSMTKKSNTGQAIWIAVGNFFSTGVALVSAMILSRYFSKEDYGTYKQVIYIYSTMQIVFTLGLPRCFSYFLPQLPIEQAKYTIRKINKIFYLTGLSFTILLFVGAPLLADAFKNPLLTVAIRIYSPVAFFLLPTLGVEGILATYQKSEYIALYGISTRVLMLLCVVLPVILFGGTYIIALWGFVFSSFITYILAIYLKNLPLKGIDHKETTVTYRDIWRFSLPLMTASIWGALSNSTDQFFISRYFGTEVFANFSNGAIQLPFVGMVMSATITVLTPVFTRGIHEGNYQDVIETWKRSTIKAAKLLFPLLVYFIIFAEPLMVAMYGKQYYTSALFFQIKQLICFTQIVSASMFIMAFGHTKFYSRSMMCAFFLLLPLMYISAVIIKSAYVVTASHVFVSTLLWAAMFYDAAKSFGVKFVHLLAWKPLLQLLIISTTVGVIVRILLIVIPKMNCVMTLILTSVMYIAIYIFIAKLFRLEYKELLISVIPPKIGNVFHVKFKKLNL